MKTFKHSVVALAVLGSFAANVTQAAPSAGIGKTATSAVQFNPAGQLHNGQQENLRNQIRTMTNNLNSAAASLGVSQANQVSWNSGISGQGSIAGTMGDLFSKVDRGYTAAVYTSGAATFDTTTWTMTAPAPTLIPASGCDVACITTSANAFGASIAAQTANTVTHSGNQIGSSVIAYNNLYGAPGSVTASNFAQATEDHAYIVNMANSTRTAVLAAKNFNFAGALSGAGVTTGSGSNGTVTITDLSHVSSLKTNGAGARPASLTASDSSTYYTIGGKHFASYTDYVTGTEKVLPVVLTFNNYTNGQASIAPTVTFAAGTTVSTVNGGSIEWLGVNTTRLEKGGRTYIMVLNHSGQYGVAEVILFNPTNPNEANGLSWIGGSHSSLQAAITAAGL